VTAPVDTNSNPEPVEEIWTFGGNRVDAKGRKAHVWVPANTEELLWFKANGSYVVGCDYTLRVVRHPDGNITKYGTGTYHGQHGDDALRAKLEAAHRAAETRLRLAAMERNAKRHSALDEALQPLLNIITQASPMDRDAILAYVLRRLSRAW
jgi:hypothetical protein